MYIFEIFFKWLNKKRSDNIKIETIKNENDNVRECNHNFMPVDSTGLILACTKCGFVVQKRDKQT